MAKQMQLTRRQILQAAGALALGAAAGTVLSSTLLLPQAQAQQTDGDEASSEASLPHAATFSCEFGSCNTLLNTHFDFIDTPSDVFNYDLALLGVTLSNQVYSGDAATQLLLEFGYDYAQTTNGGTSEYLHPVASLGYKQLTSQDGTSKNLFAIVVRGTQNLDNFLTDFRTDIADGAIAMFDASRGAVVGDFKDFIPKATGKTLDEIQAEENYFFLTGHSLGAATANALSVDSTISDLAHADKGRIYTYTFESPHTCINLLWMDVAHMSNAFNFKNEDDDITDMPRYTGSTTYGTDVSFKVGDLDSAVFTQLFPNARGGNVANAVTATYYGDVFGHHDLGLCLTYIIQHGIADGHWVSAGEAAYLGPDASPFKTGVYYYDDHVLGLYYTITSIDASGISGFYVFAGAIGGYESGEFSWTATSDATAQEPFQNGVDVIFYRAYDGGFIADYPDGWWPDRDYVYLCSVEEGSQHVRNPAYPGVATSWYARFASMVSAGGYYIKDQDLGDISVGYSLLANADEDYYDAPNDYGYDLDNVEFCLYDIDGDGTPELLVYNGFNGLAAYYVFAYQDGNALYCGLVTPSCNGIAGHAGLIQKLYYLGDDLYDHPEYVGIYEEVVRTCFITLEDYAIVKRDISIVGYPTMGASEQEQVVLFETDDAELLTLAQAATISLDYPQHFVSAAYIQERGWDAFATSQIVQDGSIQPLSVSFDDGDNGEQTQRTLSWGFDLFDRSANAYSHDLAWAALYLAEGTYHGTDGAEARMADLGFGFPSSVYYDGWENNEYMPAATFASARIIIAGQEKIMIAVAVRGTQDLGDMTTDALGEIGDGYLQAAQTIQSAFESYYDELADIYAMPLSADDTVLFITGHSLGGAVAGNLGRLLIGYADQNCTFIYTFASPKYEMFSLDASNYPNIHNIVNKSDFVPMYTGLYGYARYGQDRIYDINVERYGSAFNIFGIDIGESWLGFNVGINANHATRTYRACLESGLPELIV